MKNRKNFCLLSMLLMLAMAVFVSGGCGGGSSGSSEFAGGAGTAENPWRIETAKQLEAVRSHLDGHFALTKDLDLSGYEDWQPIGNFKAISEEDDETPAPEAAFTGTFDGGGHSISNVKVASAQPGMGTGLFGCMTGDGAIIKNLTVVNAEINGGAGTGAVVGYAHAPESADVRIESVVLSGDNKVTGTSLTGGLAGAVGGPVLVKGCTARADVVLNGDGMRGTGQGVGIVVGGGEGCNIEDSHAVGGSVTANGRATMSIGGFAGCAQESGYVKNCSVSDVTVTVNDATSSMIGGLLGHAGAPDVTPTEISGCTTKNVTIRVSDGASRIGMIVGGGFYCPLYVAYFPVPNAFNVTDCKADGSIEGGRVVGTVAGYVYNNSTVKDCTANVTINGAAGQQIGGDDKSTPLASFDFAADGSGTEADPWQIKTADQLNCVRNNLDGHYVLMNDVALSGYRNWQPIGSFKPVEGTEEDPQPEAAFTGVFDGGGHTVSSITVNAPQAMGTGLFGCMTGDGAAVKNLTVEDAKVNGLMCVAGVVGYAHAPESADVRIEKVTLTGSNKMNAAAMVGGIAGGVAGPVLLKGCSAQADVVMEGDGAQGMGQGAGLIVGGGEVCNFDDCHATGGSVTAKGNATAGIGALAGCAMSSKYVKGCSAKDVKVVVESPTSALISGLVGYAGTTSGAKTQISGCKTDNVTVAVTAGSKRIGMIVGGGFYFDAYKEFYPEPTAFEVEGCDAKGSISGGAIVGTIAGYVYNNSTVADDCTADVTVIGDASPEKAGGDKDHYPLDTL